MSQSHHEHEHHEVGPVGEAAIEPDETPDRFIAWLGLGLTVTIFISILIALFLFDTTLTAEREAKGYSGTPAQGSEH